jgi:hypothetical protein
MTVLSSRKKELRGDLEEKNALTAWINTNPKDNRWLCAPFQRDAE